MIRYGVMKDIIQIVVAIILSLAWFGLFFLSFPFRLVSNKSIHWFMYRFHRQINKTINYFDSHPPYVPSKGMFKR